MRIIKPYFEILQCPTYEGALRIIETCARTCYKSGDKIGENTAELLILNCIKRGHHSIVEHVSVSVRFVTSRSVTHELVRSRLCSYSQTSTRFVNYGGNEIEFIQPYWISDDQLSKYLEYVPDTTGNCELSDTMVSLIQASNLTLLHNWMVSMQTSAAMYQSMIDCGLPPQAARGVLPNDLKTEIVMTANLRQLRWMIQLRSDIAIAGTPHPDIAYLFNGLLIEMKDRLPVFFEDLHLPYKTNV